MAQAAQNTARQPPTLLTLPSELREIILSYVLLAPLPPVFAKGGYISIFPYPDVADMIEGYRELSSRYAIMCTCRTFYAEGSPIFWGTQRFELDLEPAVFASHAEGKDAPYALENLGDWIVRSGIKSRRCRQKVKQLSVMDWEPPRSTTWYASTYEHDPDWWRQDVQKNPAVSGLDGFDNVTTLKIELSESGTHLSCFPAEEDVPKSYTKPGAHVPRILIEASRQRQGTGAILRYLLTKLATIKEVLVEGFDNPGEEGLTWYGRSLHRLGPETTYIKYLSQITQEHGVKLRSSLLPAVEDEVKCYLCGQAWSVKHWSPINRAGECAKKNERSPRFQTADWEGSHRLFDKFVDIPAVRSDENVAVAQSIS